MTSIRDPIIPRALLDLCVGWRHPLDPHQSQGWSCSQTHPMCHICGFLLGIPRAPLPGGQE